MNWWMWGFVLAAMAVLNALYGIKDGTFSMNTFASGFAGAAAFAHFVGAIGHD